MMLLLLLLLSSTAVVAEEECLCSPACVRSTCRDGTLAVPRQDCDCCTVCPKVAGERCHEPESPCNRLFGLKCVAADDASNVSATCKGVAGVTFENVTSNATTVRWENGDWTHIKYTSQFQYNSTLWQLENVTPGKSSFFRLEGLKSNVTYHVTLAKGDDNSSEIISFRTKALCLFNGTLLNEGESSTEGCERRCRCEQNGLQCEDRCLHRPGSLKDPQCEELSHPTDPCCAMYICAQKKELTSAPHLIITGRTPSSVSVAWDDFKPPSYERGYVVEYKMAANESKWTLLQANNTPMLSIESLIPNTKYQIRVSIWDDQDTLGSASEIINVSTTDGCMRNNRTYRVDDEWFEGCEFKCSCRPNSTAECLERCPRPLYRADSFPSDPRCSQTPSDKDSCCVSVLCDRDNVAPDSYGIAGATSDHCPNPSQISFDLCVSNCKNHSECSGGQLCCPITCGATVCTNATNRTSNQSDACFNIICGPLAQCHIHENVPRCECVSGAEGDPNDFTRGCSFVPSTASPIQNGSGCTFKNTTYPPGERFFDGCDYRCLCNLKAEIECEPRCSPLAQSLNDPTCHVVQDPEDTCCNITLCSSHPGGNNLINLAKKGTIEFAEASDGCTYQNQTYKRDDIILDGCAKNCTCRGGGFISCTPRCQSAPVFGSGCTTLPDPTDSCCNVTLCTNSSQVMDTLRDNTTIYHHHHMMPGTFITDSKTSSTKSMESQSSSSEYEDKSSSSTSEEITDLTSMSMETTTSIYTETTKDSSTSTPPILILSRVKDHINELGDVVTGKTKLEPAMYTDGVSKTTVPQGMTKSQSKDVEGYGESLSTTQSDESIVAQAHVEDYFNNMMASNDQETITSLDTTSASTPSLSTSTTGASTSSELSTTDVSSTKQTTTEVNVAEKKKGPLHKDNEFEADLTTGSTTTMQDDASSTASSTVSETTMSSTISEEEKQTDGKPKLSQNELEEATSQSSETSAPTTSGTTVAELATSGNSTSSDDSAVSSSSTASSEDVANIVINSTTEKDPNLGDSNLDKKSRMLDTKHSGLNKNDYCEWQSDVGPGRLDVGGELAFGCRHICRCLENRKISCKPITCPYHHQPEISGCLDWSFDRSFLPTPGNCCAPATCKTKMPVKTGASCEFRGRRFSHLETIPSSLIFSCDQECRCFDGNVSCESRCAPVSMLPPSIPLCPPTNIMLLPVPGDDCCKEWRCQFSTGLGDRLEQVDSFQAELLPTNFQVVTPAHPVQNPFMVTVPKEEEEDAIFKIGAGSSVNPDGDPTFSGFPNIQALPPVNPTPEEEKEMMCETDAGPRRVGEQWEESPHCRSQRCACVLFPNGTTGVQCKGGCYPIEKYLRPTTGCPVPVLVTPDDPCFCPYVMCNKTNPARSIQNFTAVALNSTSVRVSLVIPQLYVGLFGQVEVLYTDDATQTNTSTWNKEVFSHRNDQFAQTSMQHDLHGLNPDTTYYIKANVLVRQTSNTVTSNVITLRTLPLPASTTTTTMLPPHVTIDPQFTVLDPLPTSLPVSWRALTSQEKRIIDGVQLKYRMLGDEAWGLTPLIHRDVTSYVLRNLQPLTHYEVDMAVIVADNVATEVETIAPTVFSTSAMHDDYAFNITLTSDKVLIRGAELHWSGVPFPMHKYVNLYVIYYRMDQDSEPKAIYKSPKSEQVTLEDLKPGNRYQIWMEAYLSNGDIRKSNTLDIMTKPGSPLKQPAKEKLETSSDDGGVSLESSTGNNSYYEALVAVAVVAAVCILGFVALLVLLLRRQGSATAPISAHKSQSAYDNPTYKPSYEGEIENGKTPHVDA